MKTEKKYTPFSKKNVLYARAEAYFFILLLVVMVWFDKDVTAIATIIGSITCGGYKLIQGLYMKMAEREHLEELRQGRRLEDLDTSDLDMEIEELESRPTESEDF